MVVVYRTLDDGIYAKSKSMKGNKKEMDPETFREEQKTSNRGGGMDFSHANSIYKDIPEEQPPSNEIHASLVNAAATAAALLKQNQYPPEASSAGEVLQGPSPPPQAGGPCAPAVPQGYASNYVPPCGDEEEEDAVAAARYALPGDWPTVELPAPAPKAANAYNTNAGVCAAFKPRVTSVLDELKERPKQPKAPPLELGPAPMPVGFVAPVAVQAVAAPRRKLPNEDLARQLAILVQAKKMPTLKIGSAYQKMYKKQLPYRGKITDLIAALPTGFVVLVKSGPSNELAIDPTFKPEEEATDDNPTKKQRV